MHVCSLHTNKQTCWPHIEHKRTDPGPEAECTSTQRGASLTDVPEAQTPVTDEHRCQTCELSPYLPAVAGPAR